MIHLGYETSIRSLISKTRIWYGAVPKGSRMLPQQEAKTMAMEFQIHCVACYIYFHSKIKVKSSSSPSQVPVALHDPIPHFRDVSFATVFFLDIFQCPNTVNIPEIPR